MNEFAIMINDDQDCDLIDNFKQSTYNFSKNNEELKKTTEYLNNYFSSVIQRIYFGCEFCQFLIPSIDSIKKVFAFAIERNFKITFVTPYVTDYGIKKLIKIFDFINANYTNIEVVFNDWGVLTLIKEKKYNFKCVAGRLIDKTLKDPRLSNNDYTYLFNEEGIRYLQHPNILSKTYQNLLISYDVTRVELDLLPQGINIDNDIFPFFISVYVPFGYVTTSRHCMIRMKNIENSKKFILNNECNCECKKYYQTLSKQKEEYNKVLYSKGNTIFFVNNNVEKLNDIKCIDRIIYQLHL